MEKYIDGYLLSVATAELQAYKMAGLARTVWLEHGALDYRECRGDELDNEAFASFTKAAGAVPTKPWCSPGSCSPARPSATASTRWP